MANKQFFRGNLGNKMFTYMTMILLKIKFGYQTYITENVFKHLKAIFENVEGYGFVKIKVSFRRVK